MTDNTTRCEGAIHEQHLCWMATQSVQSADSSHRPSVEEQQALSRNPRFRCDWCGRVAARDKNLCRPVKLKENERCASEPHEQHLCHMVAQAVLRQESLACYGGWPIPQGCEDLVRGPRFRCRTCGRPAKSDENLCTPTEIP